MWCPFAVCAFAPLRVAEGGRGAVCRLRPSCGRLRPRASPRCVPRASAAAGVPGFPRASAGRQRVAQAWGRVTLRWQVPEPSDRIVAGRTVGPRTQGHEAPPTS
jgi:hypothetical protein